MNIHNNPLTDNDCRLHAEPLECTGCNELFNLTVRTDDSLEEKRYCANCFGHVFGLDDYQTTMKMLNGLQKILWTTKVDDLPEPIKKNFTFGLGGKEID